MAAVRSRVSLLLLLLVVAVAFAFTTTVNAAADVKKAPTAEVNVGTDTKLGTQPAETNECLAQQTELDEHKLVLESTKEDHGKLLTELTIMRDEYATLVTKLSAERTKTEKLSTELKRAKEVAQTNGKDSESKLKAAKSECDAQVNALDEKMSVCEGKVNGLHEKMNVCEKAKEAAPSVERQNELEASVETLKEDLESMKASQKSDKDLYAASEAKLKSELNEYKNKYGGQVEDLLKELAFHRQGVHVVAWERFKVKAAEADVIIREYFAIALERAQFYGGEVYEKASFYCTEATEKASVYGAKAAEVSKEWTAVLRMKAGDYTDIITTFNQDVVQPKYATFKRGLQDTYTQQWKPAFDTAYSTYVPQVVEATEPHWKRAQDLYERKVRTQFDIVNVFSNAFNDVAAKATVYHERTVNSLGAARARAISNFAKVTDTSAEDAEWAVDWIAFTVLAIVLKYGRKLVWVSVKASWRLTVLSIKVGLLFAVVVGGVLVYDKATGYKL